MNYADSFFFVFATEYQKKLIPVFCFCLKANWALKKQNATNEIKYLTQRLKSQPQE